MENTLKEKVLKSIEVLKDKQARIYFLTQDTKGNAKASVRFIYQVAKTLKDAGFNPIILHEKNDYAGVAKWLGEEYMNIPHRVIEGQNKIRAMNKSNPIIILAATLAQTRY